jgi:predicted SAM-dependent methyltransferase
MMVIKMKNLVRRLLTSKAASPASTKSVITRLVQERGVLGRSVLCNLGCGTRHHPEWINIDFVGDGEVVLGYDLRIGIPLQDNSCDVLYSSHAIEHFDRVGARRFLVECRRVLKPGGIIRLVAPDLEGIVRAYLSCLDAARRGDSKGVKRYEWITIELLDQLVRHQSGGEMLKYWCQDEVPEEEFVAERVGTEYWRARKHCRGRVLPDVISDPLAVGKFRLGGEIHQWMYDSFSLGRTLADAGFQDVRSCAANESAIVGFSAFNLDTEPDGAIYKPDSFFLEAKAP